MRINLDEIAENTAVEIRQGYSTAKRKKIILAALKLVGRNQMNIEAIVHKAAVEIDRTKKGDVDRIEVIVLQAVRDGAKAILRTNLGKVWPEPTKKNPNRGYVSE